MATKQSSSSAENGRPLVIVESPAKAKTISKFLGSEFDVRASVGHVADLPSKGLAVDVDDGFKPTYELTDRGRQVVKELRIALKEASELYLATDEDREGEAISWHLLQHLKPKVPVKRMVFHEITRGAIDHAVENPREIDDGLVDAAETRRILDRLYGYEVSPILWRKVNRGLSAGRVQSPSIRLIVERERERILLAVRRAVARGAGIALPLSPAQLSGGPAGGSRDAQRGGAVGCRGGEEKRGGEGGCEGDGDGDGGSQVGAVGAAQTSQRKVVRGHDHGGFRGDGRVRRFRFR